MHSCSSRCPASNRSESYASSLDEINNPPRIWGTGEACTLVFSAGAGAVRQWDMETGKEVKGPKNRPRMKTIRAELHLTCYERPHDGRRR